MNIEQIAYHIKFLREQRGWTQKELAEQLATSRSVIAKWESHVAVPDLASLIQLSAVFQVTIDHLVGNQKLSDELLKEFKLIYGSSSDLFDAEAMEFVEYAMQYPDFKMQIHRLRQLPFKKQMAIHRLFANLIQEYEQL